MSIWHKVLLLALAGSAGTLARYFLSGAVQRMGGFEFPFGTWTVNVLGCFLFGLVWACSQERFLISGETMVILLVGFMGAFTTFSTYVFESAQMIADARWRAAALNLLGQNVFGFTALYAGILLGRVV